MHQAGGERRVAAGVEHVGVQLDWPLPTRRCPCSAAAAPGPTAHTVSGSATAPRAANAAASTTITGSTEASTRGATPTTSRAIVASSHRTTSRSAQPGVAAEQQRGDPVACRLRQPRELGSVGKGAARRAARA